VKGDQQRIILAKLGPVVLEGKKLKRHPPFSIFSNGGHVGWRSELPDTNLKGDHPRTI
jgi:hypothetical protein